MKKLINIAAATTAVALTGMLATSSFAGGEGKSCGSCTDKSSSEQYVSLEDKSYGEKKDGEKKQYGEKKDIVATALAAGQFNTLATALTEAGLVETLQGDGPFTVFAPTDEAFAELPDGALDGLLQDKEALKSVLLYHVVAGQKADAKTVTGLNGQSVETASGESVSITVENGEVFLNGDTKVIKTDVTASNGIIHVIDGVLMP